MKKSRLAIALLILFLAVPAVNVVKAEDDSYFYCTSLECPGEARCSGNFYLSSGTCQVTCYLWYGGYFYVPNGTADCQPMVE